MTPEVKASRTSAASAYLATRGLAASPSYLEKCRTRGADDPRDHGPDYWRDECGICWYEVGALDRYAASRLAGRQFRTPMPQPANFRRAS